MGKTKASKIVKSNSSYFDWRNKQGSALPSQSKEPKKLKDASKLQQYEGWEYQQRLLFSSYEIFDTVRTTELKPGWLTLLLMFNLLFSVAKANESPVSTAPCEPVNGELGKINCAEIRTIQETGLKKVDKLLSITSAIYANPNDPNLTQEQEQLLLDYREVIAGYQPMVVEIVIERSKLEPCLRDGIMDSELRFYKSTHYLAIDDEHGFKRYAYDFEERNGQCIAKTISCLRSQGSKAPLVDLKYMLQTYYSSEAIGMSDHIKEFDAVIHQLFENYPKMYEFFFPGLKEYHQKRSDVDYQSCTATL